MVYNIENLKRDYLRSFSGLTSLHSVKIQPNLILHPPPQQNFLDPPLRLTACLATHVILPGIPL